MFDPGINRANDMSWKSLFTRPIKALPLGDDIESFCIVKCPKCGHLEEDFGLKVFGIIPGRQVKLVLFVLFVIVIVFGCWIVGNRP